MDGGAHIGRYVVLYRHGRGGMGHIYAAYDPELDRRVAIKLLKRSRRRGRDAHARMIREAQALARLSHPNVVAIHDVGVHEGRVWVAMDFIEGLTLRRWVGAQTRTMPELLEVFMQAGRGLAAAHKAGLVHRDFKPENVIVDGEGRAQVLDFGLARASVGGPSGIRRGSVDSADRDPPGLSTSSGSLSLRLTRDGALVGTPAYMAPEQHLREPSDERTDQFAFCLALYEALYREAPFAGDDEKQLRKNVIAGNLRAAPRKSRIPTWLRTAMLRGLSVEPGHRWPSMDALLTELSSDHSRRRRWVTSALATLSIVGVGVAIGTVALSSDRDRCAESDAPVEAVWNAERRATVEAAFTATGKPYAAAAWRNTVAVLDAHAVQWADARRQACEATWVQGVQSEDTLVLRVSCLQRRLDDLDGLVSMFEHADNTIVERAVSAAHDLTSVLSCADVEALSSRVPLPEDPRDRVLAEDLRARLSEARTHERAGKYRKGVELAATAVEDARALAFRPLEAEALVTLGRLQALDGSTQEAHDTLREAVFAAEAGGHVDAAAQAWVQLVEVAYGHPDLHDTAADWERHGAALVERLGRGSVLDAELQRTVGNLRRIRGQPAEAVRHLRRGVEILEARVGETPALGEMLSDLGNAYTDLGRLDDARQQHERGRRILTEQLGGEHPRVASAMTGLALTLDELGLTEQSFPLYEQAVEIFRRALGPDHPSVATALNNHAGVLYAQEQYAEALRRFEQAEAIWAAAYGDEHPDVALTLGNIGLALEGLERWDEAIDHHRRALEVRVRAWGPDHPDVEVSLRNLGDLYWSRGRFDEAREHHRRAVDLLERTLGPDHLRVATALEGLAGDLRSLSQFEPALEHYRRALAIRERTLGADHEFVAGVRTDMGQLHLEAGQPARALPSLRDAMRVFETRSEASATAARCRFALAQALALTDGDMARARRFARRAQTEFAAVNTDGAEAAAVAAWLDAHRP